MMTYGYCRVSTRPQVDSDSLEVQERMIRGRALQDGQNLAHLYVEKGVSGSRNLHERPAGSAMLATIRSGDTVIAPRLDRLFRNASNAMQVLEQFRTRSIHLILLDLGGDVTGGGIASMTFTIMAAVAAFERERIAERVREMKEHEKAVGKYRGGKRPYGWRPTPDKRLEPIPEEQAAMALVLKLAGERLSLRRIQAAVADGLGLKISHTAIQRVIRDARIRQPAA